MIGGVNPVRRDVAAMYTDHTATVCASCFERPKALRQCDGCKRFALCAGCDEGLHATPSSAEEAEARLAEAYGKSRLSKPAWKRSGSTI